MRQRSGETAYDQLMSFIRTGEVQPGDRLREEDLCSRLSMSRTPVREALRRLEADGIVEHRPRVGAVLRKLNRSEMVELYEMRTVLERTAAELAARHATPAEIDVLAALNDDIAAETSNPAKAAAINQEFHRALYHAGRNRFLLEAARSLNNSLMLMGPTTYTNETRIEDVVAQHAGIVSGLRAGDAEAAGQAAEAHLQASLRYRLRVMDK